MAGFLLEFDLPRRKIGISHVIQYIQMLNTLLGLDKPHLKTAVQCICHRLHLTTS